MIKKRALITGITGMDGSHLADLLLEKGYEVFGMERRTSTPNRTNIEHLEGKVTFVNGDLSDQMSLLRCLKKTKPDEIYNLAAQSFVYASFITPVQSSDVDGFDVRSKISILTRLSMGKFVEENNIYNLNAYQNHQT